MIRVKITGCMLALLAVGGMVKAQSIDEGKKFLYYERNESAKDVFSKLVTANPNNVDAVYWLGQTELSMDDTTAARDLYQKTLQSNPNSPLLMVGVGHVELMDNKNEDARNRFETAISLTKAKDANVLNAIGRANVDAKGGDANYAVEKLKLAIERDKKNPDIYINLGDAYRKLTDGANAQISYQGALALDAKNARADYMIGRIYQTQGVSQEQYYMKYYNDAIAADPNFAPVYYWLYDYYYRRDVNKSKDYLTKYIAVADQDSKNCYYQASILFATKAYQESIAKSDECISAAGTEPVYPSLYGLKAYSYDKLGDSVKAKEFFETYFQKQNVEKIGPNDYATYARVLLKFPGNEMAAANLADSALARDTVEADKLDFINAIAESYLASSKNKEAGDWYAKILVIKKDVTKTDLYNAAYNSYLGGNCKAADSIYGIYIDKYPDEIYGYKWRARASECMDSTRALGLANPYYEKVIALAEVDTAKETVKPDLISAYNYMVAYSYNIKNDLPAAIDYTEKIIAVDPTNEAALKNETALKAAAARQKSKGQAGGKEKTTSAKEKSK